MIVLLLSLIACGGEAEEETCDVLCDQLVKDCEYGAFPSYDSCVQGCSYDAANGVRVSALSECIANAGCDTFAILDCEHQFGQNMEAE